MRNLFKKRVDVKPYEYPELLVFKDAIRHSYWLHTEFNFTADVQDYKVHLNQKEKDVLTKSLLAIAQVEVAVKRFWADLYYFFPKPEISAVSITFAESEERHQDAYSFLLERLGLNHLFEDLSQFPALQKRIEYMESFMKDKNKDNKSFILALLLFSVFVEHISLFSQFLIAMSFNKHRNQLKGISNAIEATSKEEEIHAKFGFNLFSILREEHSEYLDEEFMLLFKELSQNAIQSELEILEWIFSEGDLDFIKKETVSTYIKNRYNNVYLFLGLEKPFEIDTKELSLTSWFDIEVLSSKENDFFYKRATDYSKKSKQITENDLF